MFTLAPGDLADLGGAAARYAHNLAALRLLRTLERAGRAPTAEEQYILARYTAFAEAAVLNRAFDDAARTGDTSNGRFTPNADLAALTSAAEQAGIRRTALTAFYTPLPIVAAIWDALMRLGLERLPTLRVLEPAAGIGHFISLMPPALRRRAEIVAVELDPVTAQILALLHPEVRLFGGTGFEQATLPEDYFDLAISNVPFSEIGVADPHLEPYLTRTLHDYFFARALTLVRPGGIVAFLTSYGTLDKADRRARAWFAQQARLLAALRLPNGVFQDNAGSAAGTDLLLLQRYHPDEEHADAPWIASDWADLPRVAADTLHLTTGSRYGRAHTPAGGMRVSTHFTAHPQDVIGTMYCAVKGGNHWLHVAPPPDMPIADALAQRLATLPILTHAASSMQQAACSTPAPHQAVAADDDHAPLSIVNSQLSPRAEAMHALYTAAKQVIALEVADADAAALTTARQELNRTYDAFLLRYGVLHARANRRLLKDLPELAFLLALETNVRTTRRGTMAQKAAIFQRPTVRPQRRQADGLSPQDALLVCLDEIGAVDPDRIAALSGQSRAAVLTALHGVIYRVPGPVEQYVTADDYLSGNIRAKLRAAQSMATLDPQYAHHITALEAALPPPLAPGEITANLGATWIPAADVADFIRSILPAFRHGSVTYHAPLARWEITDHHGAGHSVDATSTWGTSRMDAISLIQETLHGRLALVYDTWREHGREQRRLNESETLAAQDKQQQLKERFSAWVWEDPQRAARLAAIYNERFNSIRLRQYDGSHLSLPGMNTSILRGGDLAPWQKDAVWQALQNPTSLIGHPVGAGKTFELLAIAHEARRMGLVSKPLVIVPNHLVEQWATEAHRLYPGMRVLAMSPDDFSQARRGVYLSRIATGDWDLVIAAHTSFTFLPVGPATLGRFIRQRIAALRRFLETVAAERDTRAHRRTIKEVERRIARYELQLKKEEAAISRDDARVITWDELGIDMLLVDEAHLFKNLEIETRMDRIAGVPRGGSRRAWDLWLKTWDLQRRGGRVVFATGTPVANTLAEVFIMMRYLQADLLERLDLAFFDAWVAAFAQVQMIFELRPDGSGFRMNTRLSTFVNLPELATLWRQCLNVRTAEQLNLPRPRLATGKPIPVIIPPAERLTAFVASLVARVDKIKNRQVTPDIDNMLRITGEGRLAALDIRLVRGGPEEPQCKINALVERVQQHYHATTDVRGAQLVFCDLATPRGRRDTPLHRDEGAVLHSDKCPVTSDEGGRDHSLSAALLTTHHSSLDTMEEQRQQNFVYDEIRDKLVARGLPRAEIAFIHEHATKTKREALFAAVRAGQVRVLIGSTAKMGTGMNVQERLIALHHLDAPWRPCDIEQREGRILRQGNTFAEVYVYQYITEGSFDAYLWQLLENKARFINQVLAAEITQRTADDVAEVVLTAAEMKALASGNPKVIQKIQLETELNRLERVYAVWRNGQHDLRWKQDHSARASARHTTHQQQLAAAIALRQAHPAQPFALTLVMPDQTTRTIRDRAAANKALQKTLKRWHTDYVVRTRTTQVEEEQVCGHYRGFALQIMLRWRTQKTPAAPDLWLVFPDTAPLPLGRVVTADDSDSLADIEEHLRGLEAQQRSTADDIARARQEHAEISARLAQPWDGLDTYQRVRQQLQRLDLDLSTTLKASLTNAADAPAPDTTPDDAGDIDALLAEISALTGAATPEPAPQSVPEPPAALPEPAAEPAPQAPVANPQSPKVAWHPDEQFIQTSMF